nr:hypothetical protein [Archangium violaceum]
MPNTAMRSSVSGEYVMPPLVQVCGSTPMKFGVGLATPFWYVTSMARW